MSKRKKYELLATCFDSRGRVLCSRKNEYTRSHPAQKRFSVLAGLSDAKIYLHAELNALLAARDKQGNNKADSLLVQRFDSFGNPKLAKPCLSCMAAIRAFKIRVVRYTTNTGIAEEFL